MRYWSILGINHRWLFVQPNWFQMHFTQRQMANDVISAVNVYGWLAICIQVANSDQYLVDLVGTWLSISFFRFTHHYLWVSSIPDAVFSIDLPHCDLTNPHCCSSHYKSLFSCWSQLIHPTIESVHYNSMSQSAFKRGLIRYIVTDPNCISAAVKIIRWIRNEPKNQNE